MVSRVLNRGLVRIGAQASQSTSYNVARHVQVGSVDDSAVAFAQTDTALNTGGAVTNMFDQVFGATPTESGQTITHTWTIATGNANFTHRRVALHDDTTTNVTTASATLVAGIDGFSLTKTADFTVTYTCNLVYTSV